MNCRYSLLLCYMQQSIKICNYVTYEIQILLAITSQQLGRNHDVLSALKMVQLALCDACIISIKCRWVEICEFNIVI